MPAFAPLTLFSVAFAAAYQIGVPDYPKCTPLKVIGLDSETAQTLILFAGALAMAAIGWAFYRARQYQAVAYPAPNNRHRVLLLPKSPPLLSANHLFQYPISAGALTLGGLATWLLHKYEHGFEILVLFLIFSFLITVKSEGRYCQFKCSIDRK